VSCSGFKTRGVVVAQDSLLDLALLRLSKPRYGIMLPPPSTPEHSGDVCIAGLCQVNGRCQSLVHYTRSEGRPSFQGSTPLQVKHDFGAWEGSSGGGVFAYHEGDLLFVGLATLGGERWKMGAYIPAEGVYRFLDEKLGLAPLGLLPSQRSSKLLWFGIAPVLQFERNHFTLPFVAVAHERADDALGVSFVSKSPLSIAAAKLARPGDIAPVHHRLAACTHRVENAEEGIQGLAKLMGCQLRLPTPDELRQTWSMGTRKRAPHGRPLLLADFDSNPNGVDVPPMGTAEWARGAEERTYEVEWSDEGLVEKLVDPRRPHLRENCFRVAFDLQEAS
jgi:hypothetical protein